MDQTLTFDVPNEVCAALLEKASKLGQPFEELALEWLLKHRSKQQPKLSDEDRKAAWQRLQRHLGAQKLGQPTGAENDGIDRDLACEYGSSHEEQ